MAPKPLASPFDRIPISQPAPLSLARAIASALLGTLPFLPSLDLHAQEIVTLTLSRDARGRIVCDSQGSDAHIQVLERSTDLSAWTEAARTHGRWKPFPIETLAGTSIAFFRIKARTRNDDDDWKNQAVVPTDDFFSSSSDATAGGMRWLKFTLDLGQPGVVHFQDGTRYPFHYPFARARLPGFAGMSAAEFDAVSLLPDGQRLALGALLLPPDRSVPEVGIQLIGRRPFPVTKIAAWLERVRDSLVLPPGWTTYYFPAFEQGELPPGDVALLESRGFPSGSASRWITSDECYSAGWAFGRLRHLSSAEIGTAYAEGRLAPGDILLADAVPSEIPVVAGTLTFTPATPNSHVALLAQSLGLPFAYVAGAEAQSRLRAWNGREVLVVAERTGDQSAVKVLDVEGLLTESQRTRLLEAQRPAHLDITPTAIRGALSVPIRDLAPSDIRYVGGKAAHFAVLTRSIPDNTPTPAIAFTFDLWNAYLDRPRPGGSTLRSQINGLLRTHTYPADAPRLLSDLATIRSWIRELHDFGPDEKARVLAALAPFPRGVTLRFRSSTNVEDSEQFSGAGLYDSYSGCVMDDQDGDDGGPSHCDPGESGERGVFRALRRVFASFYNDNAVLERLRRGVDESTVGMAVLVHPSFPDEIELANGVATLRVTPSATPDLFAYDGEWVTQAGAVSVSNPKGNARPESVAVSRPGGEQPRLVVRRTSSLVPLGGTVMAWPSDYRQLFDLLHPASVEFAKGIPTRPSFVLDFEYKRVAPGRLAIKQVREVPPSPGTTNLPPFTLNNAARLVVFQHHGKDLHANHRLKSIWQLQSLTFPGSPGAASSDFLVDLQRHDGSSLRRTTDRFGSFSNATLVASGTTLDCRWSWTDGPQRGNYRLLATFARNLNPALPPPLSDALNLELSATYAEPQVSFEFGRQRVLVTNETTRLVPIDNLVDGQLPRRITANVGRVRIETDYTLAFLKFGAPGIGIFDGKSFPLTRWRGTRISGLTTQPILLNGEFSQTYDSTRHNFVETFLFEPALEPGIDPDTLKELRAANVRRIRLEAQTGFPELRPSIQLWGFNDQLRNPD